jgi:imidazole glycerol-phosphate synthase subunit HisF
MEHRGAGEILLTSIDREGTMTGYDLELIESCSAAVDIPVIANGGAGKAQDFGEAIHSAGASAAAAGSLVVYFGRQKAVLINFPPRKRLDRILDAA